MPQINPELLAKLSKKLEVSEKRVYALIAAKANQTLLPRYLAALALAAEKGINVNKKKFATEEDRLRLSGNAFTNSGAPQSGKGFAKSRPVSRARQSRLRKSNSVFVVHGRNLKARDAMFEFLRSIGLQPIEWSQAVKSTRRAAPYVGEVLDAAFRKAAAVVVLLTPDDEARLKRAFVKASDPNHEKQLTGQPRPNVLFEAGRAFGSHADSTVLAQIGDIRPFSDTAGVHVVRLTNAPEPRRDLANRLEGAGCAVDISGTDWLSAGDFSP